MHTNGTFASRGFKLIWWWLFFVALIRCHLLERLPLLFESLSLSSSLLVLLGYLSSELIVSLSQLGNFGLDQMKMLER
jgi:hypothetical protein